MFARFASSLLLGRLREGRLEILEDGRRHCFGPPSAPVRATLRVHDPSFWRALLGGSRGLAEAYGAGVWDSDDLVALARMGAREMSRLDRWRRPLVPLRDLASRIPRNTREGARRHVAAHYDLGNDLFRLFLDESMTYSCAVFERPAASLREAQETKLERICRKLRLGPEDHVLEIGTGWGSFALHAAERFGCQVTTTTISREQHEEATQRVREAGLDDRVTVLLEDYRDVRGRYDKLVSIEMIEAVGWQYFDLFFRRCGELLDPRGLMLLQAIVIDDRAYEVEKASRSFIKELIFPSGCLPSVEVISRCVARATRLRMLDLEDITGHYPETLQRWRKNFVRFAGRAGELGYDLRFRRVWELYLAYCEGGFLERRIGDVQALLAGPAYRGPAPRYERGMTALAGS
ncbi:MAG TPA: cyclopropane-fatty-acyl-phospholipid synthase family protein [Thermoleophilaceae bacterium]|nr:cyclopropane-fatty-acyl-phospholipid synthase family protein [Thermoleophilaceae bacterium]